MPKHYPKVSCVCPTFGRFPKYGHLLGEAVESFIRQDYPADRRELIILNDCPDQVLTLANPVSNVVVMNRATRCKTLGEKYNEIIRACNGDLVLPWEDDDISLPWRIRQAVEKIGDLDYWKPPQVIFYPNGSEPTYRHNVGVRHHAGIFSKDAWRYMLGYPHTTGSQDAQFDAILIYNSRHEIPEPNPEPWKILPPQEWAYIYRWGVSDTHVSSQHPHQAFYDSVGSRPIPRGVFKIDPAWYRDYSGMCRDAITREFPIEQKVAG